MHTLQDLIQAELTLRQDLKDQVLAIVQARCESGAGRVQRGALHLYIYRQLGFHGSPGTFFAKFITKVMTEAGYRDSYLVGARCYYGLKFIGELPENWRNPQAEDLPVWLSNQQKFGFRSEIQNVQHA